VAGRADTQVIIVGAGPVGLMVAGELRLGGVEVIVLEQLDEPITETRASTVHARTMEILDQRGLLQRLGVAPQEAKSHFGGLPLDLAGLSSIYPGQWKVAQPRVEALLQEWAVGLGAEVRRGYRVSSLTVRPGHIEVGGPDGARLRAAYVVGCDGEQSLTRHSAGIGFPGRDATGELLAADVAGISVPGRRFERLSNGLATAARRPDGITRVMVHEFGRPVAEPAAPPTFAEVAQTWGQVTGEDITGGTPLWLHSFRNASRLAFRYREGRVLLAGDAAHQQLPAGGQALNLGLQDAANLGWKLAAVAAGRGPDTLLDSYHEERHAVGQRVLSNIEAQSLLLMGGRDVDPVRSVLAELMAAPRVRARLGEMISGLDVHYDDPDPAAHPLVGARVPHVQLHTGPGERTTVASLLRTGRGLLLVLRHDPAEDLAAGMSGWAGRVDVVSAIPGTDGPLGEVAAVLVRPDGYVAWVAGVGADRDAALRRWFGPYESENLLTFSR
jgi:oxygenase